MIIPYSDNKCDIGYLKVKWTYNKSEDRVLINNISVEYIQKRAPIIK